ncbi:MAG: hypothetical protein FWH57_00945 [Oscillospiraceae bacterium]|nr:hypothetical protein [Oscillospiraceae bacterium]
MRKRIYKANAWDFLRGAIVPILFTVAVMLMIVYGLSQTERSSRVEGLRILEDSIRRATVMCYAVEGRYPDTIKYLEENYGIRIDWSKYAVHYSIFASNLFPDITVIELV